MPTNFIRYDFLKFSSDEQLRRAREFFELCNRRRTVRHFSSRAISRELLKNIIRTAGTAPSGANKQPWRFIVVTNPELKSKIRIAAENEEKQNYEHRMSQEWLDDLAALGTD
jgi:iodotyrosine deiodinase